MVSGMFTTFYDISLVRFFYWSLIAMTSILIAIFAFQNRKYHLKHFFIPSAISFSFCFILFVTGCIISNNHTTEYKYLELEKIKIVEVIPTKKEIKSIILYSFDSSHLSLEDEGKLSIRTLAEQGNLVISAETTQGFDGLDEYKKVYQYALNKSIKDKFHLFLIGQAEGGRFAFITSATNYHENLKGVWTIGIASDWPFDELSPENYIKQKCPITIIHGSEDKTNFIDNAKGLYQNLLKENKKVKLKIIKGSNHYLLNERTDVLKNIDN